MTDRQQNLEQALYADGFRCGTKGLGLSAQGKFVFSAWTRLIERARAWGKLSGQERLDGTYTDAWREGIQDGYEKRSWRQAGGAVTAESMAAGWC